MSKQRRPGGIAAAFRNRAFRVYTLGSIPSVIGIWIQRAGVAWLTWELTESAAWLGAMGFADLFPVVLIGPFAGAFADRLDRLVVGRVIQIISAAQALALAVLTATGLITVEILFALTLLLGALNASFQPFRQSIIANMVGRDELPAVIAVNSSVWHGSRFIGPAVAGVIIATWGVIPAFALNALTYFSFIIALFLVKLPPRTVVRRSLSEVPGEIAAGFRYAFTHKAIAPILIILIATSFLGRPVMELLPGFAVDIFQRGADGFAWLLSSAGFGATVAGLWFAQWGRQAWLTRVVVASVVVLGLSLTAFAMTGEFWLAVAALAVVGAASVTGGISSQTVVQSVVVDHMRGRAMSIYGIIWLGCPAMGALVSGVLAEFVGLRPPVIGAGLLCLAAFLWAFRQRRVIENTLAEHEAASAR